MRRLGQAVAIAAVLLLFSPHWIPMDPWLVRGAAVALFVVGLTIAVAGAVLANLPEDARMTPIADADLPEAMVPLFDRVAALGFERLGPALRVHLDPEASIVPLWNAAERTYATVFSSSGQPGQAHYDFVTLLGDEVGLTSAANPASGVLPLAPGSFLQIFPGAEPAMLFERHREGRDHLEREAGLAAQPCGGSFEEVLARALRRQRHAFLRAPVRNTWTALRRVAAKSTPALGPVALQRATRDRIEALGLARAEDGAAVR